MYTVYWYICFCFLFLGIVLNRFLSFFLSFFMCGRRRVFVSCNSICGFYMFLKQITDTFSLYGLCALVYRVYTYHGNIVNFRYTSHIYVDTNHRWSIYCFSFLLLFSDIVFLFFVFVFFFCSFVVCRVVFCLYVILFMPFCIVCVSTCG